ncbi:MAG: hypothetical protein JKY61_08490, partial [Planctomycetes bacterium]|nr:hypothetical protein [Planctomycetota bacterium]
MLEAFMAEVQEDERDSIRQLVHGMRLFALSAQKDLSPKVDLPMIAAKNALRSLQSGRLQVCLDLILDRTLRMAGVGIGQGTFGIWPESAWLPGALDMDACSPEEDARRLAGAWSYLRGAVPEGTILPLPGVSWRRSVERVLSIAAQLDMPRAWVRLWKLRMEWVLKGPDCAEKSLGRWSDSFGSDASAGLLETVALHRATLAFGRGRKDQARSFLDGIKRTETGVHSMTHKALLGWVENEGPPSIGVVENGRSTCGGKSAEGNGGAGRVWSWDGLWGVQ